ncbi:amidohydrolase family protein [Nocardioides insulae]|uniref:amidohydrolase family protein n=1 Tax=Nocardioides insulae TaxID=394734 RepID=UPI00048F844C|nr:amidohydrolase family protein [Nocardioides insulae]
MRRVIDMEADLPPAEDGTPRHTDAAAESSLMRVGPERMPELEGYGFRNYDTIFSSKGDSSPGESLDSYTARMERASITLGVTRAENNAATAQLLRDYPGRFLGLSYVSPLDGMRAVRELERSVREDGLGGFSVSSLYNNIPASDRRYYPLYAKCVELDVPVRIYTAMNYANDRPYDVGHPRHLDPVAVDFPELRIVAGLGGWPWVNEMTALLRRHPNLYCDTAAHRPKYFGKAGSGWEQFLHFGNSLIQHKVMIGLSASLIGEQFEVLIDEYEQLPLKATVLDRWFHDNAMEFFRLG